MFHRIFLAVNLPENVKNRLTEHQERIKEMFISSGFRDPVRWTKKENLHITLVFLGQTRDIMIPEICRKTEEAVSRNQSFFIGLREICYAPPRKMPPRMVWVSGEKSEELAALQTDLEKALLDAPSQGIRKGEKRAYSPHITLGRIRQWDFKKMAPEERPQIREDIVLDFPVESVEIMESNLKRTGAEYTVMESIPLIK